MICYGMIWNDNIDLFLIWYDMVWYGKKWHSMILIWYDVMWYDVLGLDIVSLMINILRCDIGYDVMWYDNIMRWFWCDVILYDNICKILCATKKNDNKQIETINAQLTQLHNLTRPPIELVSCLSINIADPDFKNRIRTDSSSKSE